MATSADEDVAVNFFFLKNPFPDLEMIDAKIGSSLKKIIQNSNFKKRVYPGGSNTDSIAGDRSLL